jgi:hypothetical protein
VEYTENGPRYRPCEVMEINFDDMRGFLKVFISPMTPARMALSDADHCRICTYFSVMYHIEVMNMQIAKEEW